VAEREAAALCCGFCILYAILLINEIAKNTR